MLDATDRSAESFDHRRRAIQERSEIGKDK
jgi:hypothetical protein